MERCTHSQQQRLPHCNRFFWGMLFRTQIRSRGLSESNGKEWLAEGRGEIGSLAIVSRGFSLALCLTTRKLQTGGAIIGSIDAPKNVDKRRSHFNLSAKIQAIDQFIGDKTHISSKYLQNQIEQLPEKKPLCIFVAEVRETLVLRVHSRPSAIFATVR
jgi:hypothetical protein